ncbi:TetR/AcrR family transcriptional regulator [Salegentibacter maritimus]|uniref:TetR/AcrR family transcriptional regulator n=1 Tax=Salegentibacter maritimus TaxID=2794347 RepID=A0ABS0TC52_9FLAO|nr:TetR/AcrR family transcriptional regulator [Salegentibacter maritimus]MBI6118624.1 TetR/AcrR family transcriptional regulator [Salegentibacter maritimus]
MKKSQITRLTILNKAFDLIYSNGYRASSIDEIIGTTKVTKGAFYYHFKNKEEMGIAIIDEILKPRLSNKFVELLENKNSPAESIYSLIRYLLMEDDLLKVELGCPASNLIQEMTPWNNSFSIALNNLVNQWLHLLIATLEKGQKNETINKGVDANSVANFILSGYWGARNLGKLEKSDKPYKAYLKELKMYLKALE